MIIDAVCDGCGETFDTFFFFFCCLFSLPRLQAMTSDSINLLPIHYQEYISDSSSLQSANTLNDLLRFHATRLAKQAQQSSTSQDESPSPQLIDCLSTLWSLSSSEIDLDFIETEQGQERIKLAISALLLSRNLVAGSRQAQNAV